MLRSSLPVAAVLLLAGCHLVLDLDDIQAQDAGLRDAGRQLDSSYVEPDDAGGLDDGGPGDAGVVDSGIDAGRICAQQHETNCADGVDDDCDGVLDCADDECNGLTCGAGCTCAGLKKTETYCTDFQDNDGDGKTDCDDTADCDCSTYVAVHIQSVQPDASGDVYVNGTVCSAPGCYIPVSDGEEIQLIARPGLRSSVYWSACPSQSNVSCFAKAGARLEVQFARLNTMFVTAGTVIPASLTSPAQADAFCATEAASAGISGSHWVAWVSSKTESALTRLSSQSSRGWVRPDGLPFADDVTDLTQQRILYPPRIDSSGAPLSGADLVAYTATDYAGQYGGTLPPCSSASETHTAGDPEAGPGAWTSAKPASCGTAAHLYCFQTDYYTPLLFPHVTGRRAFVAQGFHPNSTQVGADSLCSSVASGAGVPGTYLALIATNTASAASRFETVLTMPWVRLDGVRVFENIAALRAGILDAPLSLGLRADGSTFPVENMPVYTGAAGPMEIGDLSTTCANWLATTGIAMVGRATFANSKFFNSDAQQCAFIDNRPDLFSVYCLEVP